MSSRTIRLAGWAGFLNLFLCLFVLTTTKDWSRLTDWKLYLTRDDPTSAYTEWFADHSTSLMIQLLSTNIGCILAVFFVYGLILAFRQPVTSGLSLAMLGSTVINLIVVAATNGLYAAGLEPTLQDDPASDLVLRAGTEMAIYVWYGSMPAIAVLMFAAAYLNHRTGTFSRWVTWTGVVGGLVLVAGQFIPLVHSGWLNPLNLGSLIPWACYCIWIAAVGPTMVRLHRSGTEQFPADAPTTTSTAGVTR